MQECDAGTVREWLSYAFTICGMRSMNAAEGHVTLTEMSCRIADAVQRRTCRKAPFRFWDPEVECTAIAGTQRLVDHTSTNPVRNRIGPNINVRTLSFVVYTSRMLAELSNNDPSNGARGRRVVLNRKSGVAIVASERQRANGGPSQRSVHC